MITGKTGGNPGDANQPKGGENSLIVDEEMGVPTPITVQQARAQLAQAQLARAQSAQIQPVCQGQQQANYAPQGNRIAVNPAFQGQQQANYAPQVRWAYDAQGNRIAVNPAGMGMPVMPMPVMAMPVAYQQPIKDEVKIDVQPATPKLKARIKKQQDESQWIKRHPCLAGLIALLFVTGLTFGFIVMFGDKPNQEVATTKGPLDIKSAEVTHEPKIDPPVEEPKEEPTKSGGDNSSTPPILTPATVIAKEPLVVTKPDHVAEETDDKNNKNSAILTPPPIIAKEEPVVTKPDHVDEETDDKKIYTKGSKWGGSKFQANKNSGNVNQIGIVNNGGGYGDVAEGAASGGPPSANIDVADNSGNVTVNHHVENNIAQTNGRAKVFDKLVGCSQKWFCRVAIAALCLGVVMVIIAVIFSSGVADPSSSYGTNFGDIMGQCCCLTGSGSGNWEVFHVAIALFWLLIAICIGMAIVWCCSLHGYSKSNMGHTVTTMDQRLGGN